MRSALTGVFFDQVWQAATTSLFGSRARHERDRVISLGPQLKAIEREHASDPEAGQQAMMKLYKASGVAPFGGCGLLLAGPVVSQATLALGTQRPNRSRPRHGHVRDRRSVNEHSRIASALIEGEQRRAASDCCIPRRYLRDGI